MVSPEPQTPHRPLLGLVDIQIPDHEPFLDGLHDDSEFRGVHPVRDKGMLEYRIVSVGGILDFKGIEIPERLVVLISLGDVDANPEIGRGAGYQG